MTRLDRFVHPYIGKDYGGERYEILSMGPEGLFGSTLDLTGDSEYEAFILGGACWPMRFVTYGKLEGRPVEIIWEDGEVSGDFAAALKVRGLAARLDGTPIGPPTFNATTIGANVGLPVLVRYPDCRPGPGGGRQRLHTGDH